jgi:hypothetical protein
MNTKNNQKNISISSESFNNINDFQIVAISTEIGRGHPSYLDSVLCALYKKKENLRLFQTTVFRQKPGISRSLWRVIHWLYHFGSRSGPVVKLYNLFRDKAAQPSEKSLALRLLSRDLKKLLRDFKGICLVAHPLLARALAETCSVWYVHGEIAAPLDCAVSKVEKIFVPLRETGDKLINQGAAPESIVVCGLMIEPSLVENAEKAFDSRLKRINSGKPLTVGFFTSGAYPSEHLRKILVGVKSVVKSGMKAVIFTGTHPQKLQWFKKEMKKLKKRMVLDDGVFSDISENWEIKLIYRKTRQAETEKTVELVPNLDLFVSPSHERTNWAVGLGLPMFVLLPLIGTFSPQNFEFAQRQGVSYPIDSMEKAQNLGKIITELRESKKLTEMAKKGFGIYRINGSEVAATHILENPP